MSPRLNPRSTGLKESPWLQRSQQGRHRLECRSGKVPYATAFTPKISHRAEVRLRDATAGEFVVRDSIRSTGWAISIKGFAGFLHYLILEVDGGVALQFVNGGLPESVPPVCSTIVDLVEHFKTTSVNTSTPVLK